MNDWSLWESGKAQDNFGRIPAISVMPPALDTLMVVRQELLRTALLKVLAGTRFSVRSSENVQEAFESILQAPKPQVAIIEVNWQRSEDFELIRLLRKGAEPSRVLAICDREDAVTFSRLAEANVQGCISKDDPIEALEEALVEVADGKTYFPAAFIETLRRQRNDPKAFSKILTLREQEVLVHVASGLTSRRIAARLNIGLRSVETYRYRLMKKLELKNAAGLTDYALRNGLELHGALDK